MLTALSIRDIVLIDSLDLDFADGLGVLTGETGAGKSILLDALGLALGNRADSGLVRAGQPQALVSASFDLPSGHAVRGMLAENELDVEPGEPVIVRRSLKADGGSRAFVNDQPVSATLLRELGGLLVEIHGQHDDRGLLNPRGHRALLDRFAGADIAALASIWHDWRAAEEQLETARADLVAAASERDFLSHSVAELSAFAPEDGEEETLAEARAAMQKGARLGEDMELIQAAFAGSESALAQMRTAARRLDRIAPEHPLLAEGLAALDRAVIEAAEAEDKLERAAEALRHDPDRLDAIETRLFDLRALARKHRVAPDALGALTRELNEKLARIDAGGEGLKALEAEAAAKRSAYGTAAEALSQKRRDAAVRLDALTATELAPLKLDAAQLRTLVEPLAESQWGPGGTDKVEFEVSTNPGAPFGPLAKIASGGELSRFILALKVALAEQGGAATMIFDEVDRGVGGAVASAIGERLHRLAERGQVLVVTHSPQVAARAASHWLIAKSHDGIVTRTGVRRLDDAERREEVARMLSGAAITDEARAQATRLLEVL